MLYVPKIKIYNGFSNLKLFANLLILNSYWKNRGF